MDCWCPQFPAKNTLFPWRAEEPDSRRRQAAPSSQPCFSISSVKFLFWLKSWVVAQRFTDDHDTKYNLSVFPENLIHFSCRSAVGQRSSTVAPPVGLDINHKVHTVWSKFSLGTSGSLSSAVDSELCTVGARVMADPAQKALRSTCSSCRRTVSSRKKRALRSLLLLALLQLAGSSGEAAEEIHDRDIASARCAGIGISAAAVSPSARDSRRCAAATPVRYGPANQPLPLEGRAALALHHPAPAAGRFKRDGWRRWTTPHSFYLSAASARWNPGPRRRGVRGRALP